MKPETQLRDTGCQVGEVCASPQPERLQAFVLLGRPPPFLLPRVLAGCELGKSCIILSRACASCCLTEFRAVQGTCQAWAGCSKDKRWSHGTHYFAGQPNDP